MKEKHFLNLPCPEIEQYSLLIPIEEIEKWQAKGWRTYQEIGLPEGDEEAWMLYGDFDKATQMLLFNQPDSIVEVDSDRLIGKKITGINTNNGTYGMGGPGYFGILLEDEEYLVYTLWNSKKYIQFNEDKIIGSTITDFQLSQLSLKITLNNDEKIEFKFSLDFVDQEDESGKEKPDDIAKYLYFKVENSTFIV